MRIIVNDVAATPTAGGVFSILKDFYDEVVIYSEKNPKIEWIFLLSGKYLENTPNIKIVEMPRLKESWIKRGIFELFSGQSFINKMKPDVYISLQNTMTLGIKTANKWVYLHQPLPYQKEMKFSVWKHNERKLWLYQHLVGRVINRSIRVSKANVIVQTEWMKKAVLDRKITDEDKVIIFPPNNIHVDNEYIQKINGNVFFYPATSMIYKNHRLLYEAARILEERNYQFDVYCTITQEEEKNLNLKPVKSIHTLGSIPRSKVMYFYRNSILVFPSLIETFGLPLLEARLSNDYILAGDTSFSNEILREYPNKVFFDPNDAQALAKEMSTCIRKDRIKSKVDNFSFEKSGSLIDLIIGDNDE